MTNNYIADRRATLLLNGWWDFQPIEHADFNETLPPNSVPQSGWYEQAYLVPGFFTDNVYPEEWRRGRGGWARARFTLPELPSGQRFYLTVQGAIPQARLFVNGQCVATQDDMFIGEPQDVTDALRQGENELAILLTEFHAFPDPRGGEARLIDVPWGCCISIHQAGLWQDITLERRPEVHVSDVTIRPSVRENNLTVITEVRNAGSCPFEGSLDGRVIQGGETALALPSTDVSLAAGETRSFTQTVAWNNYRPWFPEDPQLYYLQSCIRNGQEMIDNKQTRFGFRELWIEGHRILLNGRPQRWYGEWGHKTHPHWLRPEYVRQWYQQLKDLNMNYVRMHTFPHPEFMLDIADEMGIMICQESALYGSGVFALDTPNLWQQAREHVRRMVWRDKNHPSLVIWSVENEMRWALGTMPQAKDELPKLRKLFHRLDPTRPAYHEGDSSLWNEDEQEIISRHYGPACHGMGWWDKRTPLHAGEMGRWHYASPFVALQWAGDEVYTDYAALARSLSLDAARIVELGRANEVSCLFIWNTSGLDNFRPAEAKTFTWPEPNTPYVKPLAHCPYQSEYAWWEEGQGYRPGFSFDIMRHSFRPLAIVIREERTQFYTDRLVPHTTYVVNDLPTEVMGELQITLMQKGQTLWREVTPLTAASGCTATVPYSIPLAGAQAGEAQIICRFISQRANDIVERKLRLASPQERQEPLDLPIVGVWGESAAVSWLEGHGAQVQQLAEDSPLDAQQTPIIIVGEHSVSPGSPQNRLLGEFLCQGGRALVLEQTHSLFPGLAIERQPIEMTYPRAIDHPVLQDITREDLRFFGDDPFGLPSSDAWVTLYPYRKPTENQLVKPLVDSSGGDFGTGGLTWAPVIEAQAGAGVVIASQLRLTDRLSELPVAGRLLRNALQYLAAYTPATVRAVEADPEMASRLREMLPQIATSMLTGPRRPTALVSIVSGQVVPGQEPALWREYLSAGNTAIVWELDDCTRPYWEQVIGRQITLFTPEHAVYQLVAPNKPPLLSGLSQEDTCWLENWTYRRVTRKERIVNHLLDIAEATVYLQNSDRSALDVLYGDEQATEWKRMPALTHFFDGPPPRVGGGLIEVPVGRGRVLFCQVRWQPEAWQLRRFLGLLFWNLGLPVATDVLAGESTPTAGRASDGYPAQVRVARGLSEQELRALLGLSKRQVEYCSDNVTFSHWPGWQMAETPDGRLCANKIKGDGLVVLGMEIRSPEPRKLMQVVGGLPNPDLQTHLRLEGSGMARVWINGTAWGEYALAPDTPNYVADIDLEAGSNMVVLAWQPEEPEAELAIVFQNKDRRPEITFTFV